MKAAASLTLLLLALPALAQLPDTLQTGEEELIGELVDSPLENEAELWELLELYGERRSQPGSDLRSRIENPADSPDPEHYLRGRYRSHAWSISALAQRDTGEPNALDLLRISAEMSRGGLRTVAGDFRLDFGLGWTLASTPSWSSTTSPYAAFRHPSQGIRPMLSSEEGRGWRGIGLRLLAREGKASARIHLWTGRTDYDSRNGEDGLIPYSTQGNHSEERLDGLISVGETALGAAFEGALGPYRLGLIRSMHLFDDPLASTGQASRFSFADQRLDVNGLTLETTSKQGVRGSLEITQQEGKGWGGGVALGRPVSSLGYLSVSGWRATLGFAPLHSRPSLASGTDPAGRSGVQTAMQLRLPGLFTASAGWFGEVRESSEDATSGQAQGAFIQIRPREWNGVRFELRTSSRWAWQSGALDSRTDLLNLFAQTERRFTRWQLRGQLGRGESGDGWGVTLSTRSRLARLLAIDLAGTYLATTGSGLLISVVEPAGPGLLPVRRLSGKRIRLAGRLNLHPLPGATIWLQGRVEHRLAPGESLQDAGWMAGLDWRIRTL